MKNLLLNKTSGQEVKYIKIHKYTTQSPEICKLVKLVNQIVCDTLPFLLLSFTNKYVTLILSFSFPMIPDSNKQSQTQLQIT